MKKAKALSSRPRRKSPGVKLSWHPKSYADAIVVVRQFNHREAIPGLSDPQLELYYQAIARAAIETGGLSCPPPNGMPGRYRISLKEKLLVVEYLPEIPQETWKIDEAWLNGEPTLRHAISI